MSISTALNNAYSGLRASSRIAQTISDNVSNALTEGHSRKSVTTASRVLDGAGAGVRVARVERAESPLATADRRRVEAELSGQALTSAARSRLAAALGEPGDPGALASRATALETALATLADAPESQPLQADVAAAARGLAGAVNALSDEAMRARMDADAAIAAQVGELNAALRGVDHLNREIRSRSVGGRDVTALEDQRQLLLDQVARLTPIRTTRDANGEISIFTARGGVLLSGEPRELGFSPAGIITPDMTIAAGGLSGLTLGGEPVEIGLGDGLLDGGALSANFAIRDVVVPGFQEQVDAFARDLIERFADPAVDPSLAAGDPGLFTDAGGDFDPADETGLAGRLAVNAAIDPAAGGALWRIRDGLGAAAPGPAGEAGLVRALAAALSDPRAPSAGLGLVAPSGASGFAMTLSSTRLADAAREEEATAYLQGRAVAFREMELVETGVDTDEEMRELLLVEQAYAANARVMEVADALLRRLMEI